MSGAAGTPVSVLIKGAGEQGSAVGHRLARCGYRVLMTDLARPTAIRRTVSFCTAIDDGSIEIEGIRAVCGLAHALPSADDPAWDGIVVCVDPAGDLVARWRPDVIVDARIFKRNADNHCTDAPLVIGLGPGLEAGRDVHVVVETNRGHDLGRVITGGFSSADTGEPGRIGGFTHERLLRAPAHGVFETRRAIGDRLAKGDLVGTVGGAEVRSAISGILRGLLHCDIAVAPGAKLADVDPRGASVLCRTISDKARTISGSVLEVVVARSFLPPVRRA